MMQGQFDEIFEEMILSMAKEPEDMNSHAEIKKWLRTHNTRDGRARGRRARNKLREIDATNRKRQARQPPNPYSIYKPNGKN